MDVGTPLQPLKESTDAAGDEEAAGGIMLDAASSQHVSGRPRARSRKPIKPDCSSLLERHSSVINTAPAGSPAALFAKQLTRSDLCRKVCKCGRITLPRVAVETNLPAVNNQTHNDVEVIDSDGRLRTFLVKSWPNGAENRRVYVMERVASYVDSYKLKVGDTIAIVRRLDGRLGVECNTEQAAIALTRPVMGQDQDAAAAGLPPCARHAGCIKAAGHVGFCAGKLGPRSSFPDAAVAADDSSGLPKATTAPRSKRKPATPIDEAQTVSRGEQSGSAALAGDDTTMEDERRLSQRTKRFKKSGDVDFAQMLGGRQPSSERMGPSSLDIACHAAVSEGEPLRRRSMSCPPVTSPIKAALVLDTDEQAPPSVHKPRTPAQPARPRRVRKMAKPPALPEADGGMPISDENGITVLCAKVLTNSDATSGRIILPRVSVEANLSFVVGYRAYSLTATDANCCSFDFVLKSWANGTEHRRVYVLEQAAPFLRAHRLVIGDAVGICSDEHGGLHILANTPEVKAATLRPTLGGAAALKAGAAANRAACVKALPLPSAPGATCSRSAHCLKPDNHTGFCSKAGAKAKHSHADSGIDLLASAHERTAGGATYDASDDDSEPPLQWAPRAARLPVELPRRPRSERHQKPTLKVQSKLAQQQEEQEDSLAAEVLISLVGRTDSGAVSEGAVNSPASKAPHSFATSRLAPKVPSPSESSEQQPLEQQPQQPQQQQLQQLAVSLVDVAPSQPTKYLPVSLAPPPLPRLPPSQCVTTGFLDGFAMSGLGSCRMPQPLPTFLPPAQQVMQIPLFH